jgi:hypothetical protein
MIAYLEWALGREGEEGEGQVGGGCYKISKVVR